MEQRLVELFFMPTTNGPAEGRMLQEDTVREVLSRLERGEGIKSVARQMGVDRKTIKRWRRLGEWRPQRRHRARQIEPFSEFVERRGPEVGWNADSKKDSKKGTGTYSGPCCPLNSASASGNPIRPIPQVDQTAGTI